MPVHSAQALHSKPMLALLAAVLLISSSCTSESPPETEAPASGPTVTAPASPEKSARATAPAGADMEVSFQLASELLPSGSVALSNGVVVRSSDWPALVVATFGSGAGRSSCSGVLIGPNTLLTAAHCVENGLGVPRSSHLRSFGRDIPMKCELHPDYLAREPRLRSPRGAEDYALCWIDYGGNVPNSIENMSVEVVETSRPVTQGSQVLLTGYGCTDAKIRNGELVKVDSANILRIGDARITRAPLRTVDDGAYVVIESYGADTPALCPGDSGGPMFTGATEASTNGARRVAGVNSAITHGVSGSEAHIISKISATGTPEFDRWIADWQRRNAKNVPIICGVSRAAGQFPCRS